MPTCRVCNEHFDTSKEMWRHKHQNGCYVVSKPTHKPSPEEMQSILNGLAQALKRVENEWD